MFLWCSNVSYLPLLNFNFLVQTKQELILSDTLGRSWIIRLYCLFCYLLISLLTILLPIILYQQFSSKGKCYEYIRNQFIRFHVTDLESSIVPIISYPLMKMNEYIDKQTHQRCLYTFLFSSDCSMLFYCLNSKIDQSHTLILVRIKD